MSTITSQLLRHVVLIKFKDGTSPASIAQIEHEFRTLATLKVFQVIGFEWGTNVSKEKLDRGYTHCFLLTFTSEQARDQYVDHDDHKAFIKNLTEYLDAATVVDYWANSN